MLPSIGDSSQSRSASLSRSQAAAFQKSNQSIVDNLFPIFDQFSESITISSSIIEIICLYSIYQLIVTCYWGDNYVDSPYIRIIAYIDTGDFISQFLVFAVYTIIANAFLVFQIANFAKTRRAIKSILYIISLFSEYLSIIIIIPMFTLLGKFIYVFFNEEVQSTNIILFVFSILFLLANLLIYIIATMLRGSSAYLDSSPFSTLDFTIIPSMIITTAILNMCQIVFKSFPIWVIGFIVVIHFICFGICFFKSWKYPFFRKSTNLIIQTIILTCMELDIVRFITIFYTNEWPSFTVLYITIVLLVISFGNVFLIYYLRQKKLKKNLEEASKDHEFAILEANRNSSQALYVLHYAIEYMSPCFQDFTLVKHMTGFYDDVHTISKFVKFLILLPDKTRELKVIFEKMLSKRNISISNRFLIYQVYRISALRQTSSSIQASSQLSRLKQFSKQCSENVISFWNSKEINSKNLYDYSMSVKKIGALWTEGLSMYPNSINFHEDFSHFLIEAATDFKKGILEIHKAAMIETGRSYSVDNCFRSFVRMFPMYLKKKIIDLKGHFIQQNNKRNGSQNSNLSSTESSTLDAKLEEDIGKVNITQAKTRIALQSLTDTRKPDMYYVTIFTMLFSLVYGLVLFVVAFVIFIKYFNSRYSDTQRSILLNTCRTELTTIYLLVILKWGQDIPVPRYNSSLFVFPDTDSIDSPSMLKGKTINQMCFIHNTNARSNYNDFLFDLVDGSKRGEDIFSMVPRIFEDLVPLGYCNGGTPILPITDTDFKSALTYQYYITKVLASNHGEMTWFTNHRYFCNIFTNRIGFANAFKIVRSNLVDGQIDEANNVEKYLLILTILFPCIMFFINFVPYFTVILFFVREINQFALLMLQSDNKFKKDAQIKISKKIQVNASDDTSVEIKVTRDYKFIIFIILFLIFDLVLAALMALTMYDAMTMNKQFKSVASWSFKSSVRIPNSFDVIVSLFTAVVMSGNQKMTAVFTDPEKELKFAKAQSDTNEQFRDDLLFGTAGFPSILGFDQTIDDIMLAERCKANTTDGDLHSFYVCASGNQLMTFFKNLFTEISSSINDYNSSLNSYHIANMLHILTYHIQPTLDGLNARIDVLVQNLLRSYSLTLIIYFVVGILLVLLKFAISIILLSILMSTYNGALMMLRRLSPVGIFANNQLFDYLLHKKIEKIASDVNVSRNIINNTSDSIMCLGSTGIIEIVNPSIQMTFGYTPEQLLGQPFTVIFEDDTIKSQIELMVSGQSGTSYKSHSNCITDNEEIIACSIELLAITDDHSTVNSFVLIIRDENELNMRMAEAEEAKKKSEDLLYQILPRDIVNRLNQGEKDISFQVPSATICFIDVVKFSEYASTLSPEDIMGNLSVMFAGFDDMLSKYNTLTKIKLIGDVYMCAAGIFSPDIDPKVHAEEMIKFALEALISLDETCNKINAVLNVRIGINTGGPLIAGVLGTDKPVFDIIGDPINIASRLQSTDVPGLIQISQTTYGLVQQLDFNIECRGEVFLKGKGKSLAYLVKPAALFQISAASSRDVPSLTANPDTL